MTLIAGSYEKFIWGFKLKPLKHSSDGNNNALSLSRIFSYPSHLSPISSVAAAGPVAASGGGDDTVHIYDLSSAASLGSLHQHSASITALEFYTPPNLSFPRNLISAAADGTVSIFDADPFVHLKTLWAHKKGSSVNSVSIHSSGKVALSVGRDECLGMINLVRGKRKFYCRLGKEATLVKYDLDGEKFFMVMEDKIGVHEAEDARLVWEMENPKKVLCAAPGESGLLYTSGEDRNITAWDTKAGKVAYCIEGAHSSRVKGIVVLSSRRSGGGVDEEEEEEEEPYLLASASSNGVIRVWDVRMAAMKEKPKPLAEADTKSRLTCLAGTSLKSLRRPRFGHKVQMDAADAAAAAAAAAAAVVEES